MDIRVRTHVRAVRLAAGLSQAELASHLGVSRQTINAIETGKYTPSLPLALLMARFFRMPVEEMFQLDEQDEQHARST
jgi:putative transcriptional regulator